MGHGGRPARLAAQIADATERSPRMLGSTKATLRKKLEEYEGRVHHFYRDTEGHVTIGVGHLVPSLLDAQKLPLKTAAGKAATLQEIETDWKGVRRRPPKQLASLYRPFVKLTLNDADIDALTTRHIDSFHGELRRLYPDFHGFPKEAQLALFDMIFNIGMPRLRHHWPKMNAAIAAKDWQRAASESNRQKISRQRNQYVKGLFEAAAKAQKSNDPTTKASSIEGSR